MTATSSPADKSEMMFIGQECNHPACHLHDFLPFSCPACKQSYCQPHFLPSQHSCAAPLPLSMVDRIAPKCPMCDEIVPYKSSNNLDPNQAVENHILSGTCTGFQGGEERKKQELRQKKLNGQICYKRNCNKSLVVKMKCEQCNHFFCPTHRHSTSHTCSPSNTPSSSNTNLPQSQSIRPAGKAALSRLLPQSMTPPTSSTSTPLSSKPTVPSTPAVKVNSSTTPVPVTSSSSSSKPLDAKAAAAAAALKRAGQDVKVPFVKTKTEKRSQAELNSTIQALKHRHDKGLLTKAEEVKYAELVGEREAGKRKIGSANSGNGDKGNKGKGDCIIA